MMMSAYWPQFRWHDHKRAESKEGSGDQCTDRSSNGTITYFLKAEKAAMTSGTERGSDGMATYSLRTEKGRNEVSTDSSADGTITYPLRAEKAAMTSTNGLQFRRHDHVPTVGRRGQQ